MRFDKFLIFFLGFEVVETLRIFQSANTGFNVRYAAVIQNVFCYVEKIKTWETNIKIQRIIDGKRESDNEIEMVEVKPEFIIKGKWKKRGNLTVKIVTVITNLLI